MQLNKSTDYAIRIILYLSKQDDLVTSEQIAKNTATDQNFIMRVLRRLKNAGIVEIVRGKDGGYRLFKDPTEISLFEVFNTMEPTMNINQCLDDKHNCSLKAYDTCPVRSFYLKFQEGFEHILKGVSIHDLKTKPIDELLKS